MKSATNSFLTSADVPRDLHLNVLWRAYIWELTRKDAAARAYIEECCRRDFIFYCDTFVFTKSETSRFQHQPFILYEFQESAARHIISNAESSQDIDNLYRRWDVAIQKSRELGVTWLVGAIIDWFWRFYPDLVFMVFSRTEDDVDKSGVQTTIFAKFDYIEARLPAWLSVRGAAKNDKAGRSLLRISNWKNGSSIQGYASNPDSGSGGRAFIVWRDEEAKVQSGVEMTAATQAISRCVVRTSTHKGAETSFALACNSGGIDVITMHWSQHPIKGAGLYSVQGGVVTVIDKLWHERHPGYEFILTPTHSDPGAEWEFLRSPWFDGEDKAQPTKQIISQELQVSQLASGSPFFDLPRLEAVKALHERSPDWKGNITEIMPELSRIHDGDGRPFRTRVWWSFAEFCVPGGCSYSMGADISSGSGASDSVLTICNDETGEELFKYKSNRVTPEDFARLCYAVCRRFVTEYAVPHFGWDMSGPGIPFGQIILRLYRDDLEQGRKPPCTLYFHVSEDKVGAIASTTPGVPAGSNQKVAILNGYQDALMLGNFITHDADTYLQCQQFVWDGGSIEHKRAKGEGTKQHGDEVMAQAVLVKVMSFRPEVKRIVVAESQRLGGLDRRARERQKERERLERRGVTWW